MDEKTTQEGIIEPPKANPLIELVKNITPDTSAKLKAFLLPPQEGIKFQIGPFVFEVGYINTGKMHFAAHFYGIRIPEGILRPGGAIETQGQQPARDPKTGNVILQVQNGSIDANDIFKPRATNGQNKAE